MDIPTTDHASDLSEQQGACLRRYLDAVLELNHELNLTRIAENDDPWVFHVIDSLIALPEVMQAPEGGYVDIGSGAGFPGVPLSVASGRPVLLVDSVKKKMDAVDRALQAAGLDADVSTYRGRAEELALERPEGFTLVTARALTALPSLAELASPLLSHGGRLVALKGAKADEELAAAEPMLAKLGMRPISDRSVSLGREQAERRILVLEKCSQPLVSLPRRPGMAQKRPYRA